MYNATVKRFLWQNKLQTKLLRYIECVCLFWPCARVVLLQDSGYCSNRATLSDCLDHCLDKTLRTYEQALRIKPPHSVWVESFAHKQRRSRNGNERFHNVSNRKLDAASCDVMECVCMLLSFSLCECLLARCYTWQRLDFHRITWCSSRLCSCHVTSMRTDFSFRIVPGVASLLSLQEWKNFVKH